MRCRNCGGDYIGMMKHRKFACPHCGEANWSDERHQIGAENE